MSRPVHEKQFGSIWVRVQNPAPRKGLRALAMAGRILGKRVISMITTGEMDPKTERGMTATIYALPEMILEGKDRFNAGATILNSMSAMEPEDALELSELLLLGQCWLSAATDEDGKRIWVTVADSMDGQETIDNIVPDAQTLYQITRWAFRCYFVPTFAAPDTGENTTAGGGSTETPAPQ